MSLTPAPAESLTCSNCSAPLVADLPALSFYAPDVLLVSLIARAALLRCESRGAHFRTDAPEQQPAWRGRIHWRRAHPPTFEEVP